MQNLCRYNYFFHKKTLEFAKRSLYFLSKNRSLIHYHYYENSISLFCSYSDSRCIQEGYFHFANLSRIVPSDFEQDVHKHIEGLLFRASLSNFSSQDSLMDKLNNLLGILKYDLYDMESPAFTLLSQSDLSHARTRAFDNIKLLFQIPKILHPRYSFSLTSDHSIFKITALVSGYDAFPHVFLNISQVENKCPKLVHQLTFEEFLSTLNKISLLYPRLLYREVDGELRLGTLQEIDRILQAFFSPMLSNEFPKMLLSQTDVFQVPNLPKEFIEHPKSGNFEHMLDSNLHLYLLEIILHYLSVDSEKYIHLHYSICRHLLKSGNLSLLKNTRHFSGLLWWVVIGEMDEINGLESLYNWCTTSKEHFTAQCVNELIDIVSRYEKYDLNMTKQID